MWFKRDHAVKLMNIFMTWSKLISLLFKTLMFLPSKKLYLKTKFLTIIYENKTKMHGKYRKFLV